MTKIVINKCHGGFGLSPTATKMYLEAKGRECYFYKQSSFGNFDANKIEYTRLSLEEAESEHFRYTITKDFGPLKTGKFPNNVFFLDSHEVERDDPDFVSIVEKLGPKVNNNYSMLEIIEIPDDVEWEIDEYDGWETIHEKHRSWG